MPRDGSGNYTLPAGNPVVAGTIITPSWANPTMDDIGVELTDSLSRSGKGGMLVPFLNQDGTEALPGIAWTAEPTMGMYRSGTQDMRASVNSQDSTRWIDGDYGFEIWSGTLWEKPVVPSSEITITGLWTLANFLPLRAMEFDGITPQDIVSMHEDDILHFGNAVSDVRFEYNVRMDMVRFEGAVETNPARFINRSDGSLLLAWPDGDGFSKAGYRDPFRVVVFSGSKELTQNEEGKFLDCSPAATADMFYTLPVLHNYTTMTLSNRSEFQLTIDLNGVRLDLSDENGRTELTGFQLEVGGVCQLYWLVTDVVLVYGSGIIPTPLTVLGESGIAI